MVSKKLTCNPKKNKIEFLHHTVYRNKLWMHYSSKYECKSIKKTKCKKISLWTLGRGGFLKNLKA